MEQDDSDNDSYEDDFGSDSWDEMGDGQQSPVDCFFCSKSFSNIDLAVSHCCKEHGLSLPKLKVSPL